MIVDVWVVSVMILVVSELVLHGGIDNKILIKSFFPTTFSNNWYLTCYLLFYAVHPFLNQIIEKMNQATLFKASAIMIIIYTGFNSIKNGLFFYTEFIAWIAVYFAVAYMKSYLMDWANNTKISITVFVIAIVGIIGATIAINLAGVKIGILYDKASYFKNASNPFLILMAISLFNLVRNKNFKNGVINHISGLSLLIYIIHENLIVRTYLRPYIWNYIYSVYGYDHLYFWILIYVLITFILSLLLAEIYKSALKKVVDLVSNRLYLLLEKIYYKFEPLFLRQNNK